MCLNGDIKQITNDHINQKSTYTSYQCEKTEKDKIQ